MQFFSNGMFSLCYHDCVSREQGGGVFLSHMRLDDSYVINSTEMSKLIFVFFLKRKTLNEISIHSSSFFLSSLPSLIPRPSPFFPSPPPFHPSDLLPHHPGAAWASRTPSRRSATRPSRSALLLCPPRLPTSRASACLTWWWGCSMSPRTPSPAWGRVSETHAVTPFRPGRRRGHCCFSARSKIYRDLFKKTGGVSMTEASQSEASFVLLICIIDFLVAMLS